MAFHEVRFPVDISWGSQGGPGFNTSVITLGSGQEQRNINWENARCEYDVAYGIKSSTQLSELIKFFYARNGKAHGFRYKDWMDYTLTSEESTSLSASSTGRTFQIIKAYVSGTATHTREIFKVCSGSTVSIFIDGTTTNYTINYNTGVIFITTTSSRTVTVTCEFDVPCRFDTDKLQAKIDSYSHSLGYLGGTSVPVIEIRTT